MSGQAGELGDPETMAVLRELVAELGMAFHPEMPVASYVKTGETSSADLQLLEAMKSVGADVKPDEVWLTFEPVDAERLQAGLDRAWELYGDGVFDLIQTIEPWKSYFERQEAD